MKKLLLVLLVLAIAAYWYFRHHHTATHTHHAWDESGKLLPGNLAYVGDLEAGAFGQTPLARKLIAKAAGDDSFDDEARWLKKLGGVCGLDLLHGLDSFVVGVPKDGGYLVIAALDRVDRDDLDACLKKLGAQITELDHGIARYAGATEEPFTLRWFDDKLFAFGLFTNGFDDPRDLLELTSGGFDKDAAMTKLAAKIDRTWIGWVLAREAPLETMQPPGVFSLAIRGGEVRMAARAFGEVAPIKEELDGLVALAQSWVQYGGKEAEHLLPLVRALEVESDQESAAITAKVPDDAIVDALFPPK